VVAKSDAQGLTTVLPAWLRIPQDGPIAEVLNGAVVTLEDLGRSRDQSRAWQMDRFVDAGRHEDDIRARSSGWLIQTKAPPR
jgi:hypothetical protein